MTRSRTAAAAQRDTIFALASAPGRAGVAVIRVSGPGALGTAARLTRRDDIIERKAMLRELFDETNNVRIDVALVLFFRGPHSYTGEDIVEFQMHGGRAVQAALLHALSAIPGLRPAEPGEFTRRAVEHGRLDLTQAEAIADLVDAETEGQRRQALRQYGGALRAIYDDWRAQLIRAAAWIEAGIDFADEALPEGVAAQSDELLAGVKRKIAAHLDDGRRGEILREGLHVAIIGPPNAGKSSLVNALAQRDVAIVSETPGTTRDVIEVRLDLGGYPVILADTAGLRDSDDWVEQEGVRRARARAEAADVRLLVLDGAAAEPSGRTEADVVVWNKADLSEDRSRPGFWISAKTGEGISDLIATMTQLAADRAPSGEAPVLTRARHRVALEEAVLNLGRALGESEAELKAEHVRLALRALGRITGRVDLDELLDVVFRDFCIGK